MLWVFVGNGIFSGTDLQEIGGCSFGREFLMVIQEVPDVDWGLLFLRQRVIPWEIHCV